MFLNKLRRSLRNMYWDSKFKTRGRNIQWGSNLTIVHPECISIGENVRIGNYTYILPCFKYAGIVYNPQIIIGENTLVGIRNSFASIRKIVIGKNVTMAAHVHITDHSHGFEDINQPILPQQLTTKGEVVIEDDCWLGFSCEILSGVHIGKHSVVAARAVVTKDVPPFSVVAGNPAKIIKQYNFDTKQWERIR